MTALLELRGIVKRFGAVIANDGVDLAIEAGTVHALVGENGAGKTTAMRIAAGWLTPDAGEVWLDGAPRRFGGPRQALHLGIGMVHQHFQLVGDMTVTENVVLGVEPGRPWALELERAAAAVGGLAGRLGLPVDPAARVESLSVGERQRVELLKVLYRGAKLLILDEPTAILAAAEVAGLFAVLRRLRDEGRTVVLITHKLSEVLEIADDISVMRAGRVVSCRAARDADLAMLACEMVSGGGGGDAPLQPDAVARWRRREASTVGAPAADLDGEAGDREAGEPAVLTARGLTVTAGEGRRGLHDVSFEVRRGEIVGVAGVEGNGQDELAEAIAGLLPESAVAGTLALSGLDLTRASARRRRQQGLAYVPADRQGRGLLLDFDLAENTLLGTGWRSPLVRGPGRQWLDRAAVRRRAAAILSAFAVQPPVLDLPVRVLSGGNQQRLMVGRELSAEPRLLVAAQPTRGVDLAGSATIRRRLAALSERGAGVLLISSDLDELLAMAHRIIVLFRGRIAGEVDPAQASREEIGQLMVGGAAPAQGDLSQPVGGPAPELQRARVSDRLAPSHRKDSGMAGRTAAPDGNLFTPPDEGNRDVAGGHASGAAAGSHDDAAGVANRQGRVADATAPLTARARRVVAPLAAWTPLLAVAAALLAGAVLIAAVGDDPLATYGLLLGSALSWPDGIAYTLFYATPLIFTGLAVAVAFRAGLFNVGAEGQLVMAALAAAAVGIAGAHWSLSPAWLLAPIAAAAAVAAGAAWGWLAGALRARFGAHEVVTTIMLNFIAAGVAGYLVRVRLAEPGDAVLESAPIAAGAHIARLGGGWLPWLSALPARLPLNFAFPAALVACGLVSLFLFWTRSGFELRAVGASPPVAAYGGIAAGRQWMIAMALSGGLAGLAAVNEVLGFRYRYYHGFSPGYGFIGIAVALLGRGRPAGVLLAALLFGAMVRGGLFVGIFSDHVSRDLVVVLEGLVIFFVTVFRRPLERWLA